MRLAQPYPPYIALSKLDSHIVHPLRHAMGPIIHMTITSYKRERVYNSCIQLWLLTPSSRLGRKPTTGGLVRQMCQKTSCAWIELQSFFVLCLSQVEPVVFSHRYQSHAVNALPSPRKFDCRTLLQPDGCLYTCTFHNCITDLFAAINNTV